MNNINFGKIFDPRPHQKEALQAFDNGMNKIILLWSRRAGKSLFAWTTLVREAILNPGVYWFCFDEFKTAERNIWSAMTSDGVPFRSMIPKDLIKSENGSKLKIELHNGSIIQLIGINDADSLVGAGLRGVVFDEYAVLNPTSIDYIEPMLGETGGWEIIISTPRGKNHFYKEYEYAIEHPDEWFASNKHCGMPEIAQYMAPGFLESTRNKIISKYGNDALYQQEYLTSWISPNSGSVFGDLLKIAKDEGRVCGVIPFDNIPFYTAWDIGNADYTSVVLFQVDDNGAPYVIDHIENQRKSAEWYADEIKNRGWQVRFHFLPFDAAYHKGAKNETYKQVLAGKGVLNTVVLSKPRLVSDKLNFLRRVFFKMRINDICDRLVTCLDKLEYEWNDSKKMWSDKPTHKGGYSDTCIGADSPIETSGGLTPIAFVKAGDMIKVGNNYHKTTSGGVVTGTKMVNTLTVGDTSMKITGNHEVLTQRGFVRVDKLSTLDTICYNGNIWKKELNISNTRESLKQSIGVLSTIIGNEEITDILLGKLAVGRNIFTKSYMRSLTSRFFVRTEILRTLINLTGGISQLSSITERSGRNTETITNEGVCHCTGRCGLTIMEQSKKATTSTTRTLTQRIITLVTLKCLALVSTTRSTGKSNTKREQKLVGETSTKPEHRKVWQTGISPTGLRSSIIRTKSILSRTIKTLLAKCAGKRSKRSEAEPVGKIVGSNFTVETNSGLMEVWNMTVENAHMYSVNGITMSNCDSMCYMAQAILGYELAGDKSPNFVAHARSQSAEVKKPKSRDEFLEEIARFTLEGQKRQRNNIPRLT